MVAVTPDVLPFRGLCLSAWLPSPLVLLTPETGRARSPPWATDMSLSRSGTLTRRILVVPLDSTLATNEPFQPRLLALPIEVT